MILLKQLLNNFLFSTLVFIRSDYEICYINKTSSLNAMPYICVYNIIEKFFKFASSHLQIKQQYIQSFVGFLKEKKKHKKEKPSVCL